MIEIVNTQAPGVTCVQLPCMQSHAGEATIARRSHTWAREFCGGNTWSVAAVDCLSRALAKILAAAKVLHGPTPIQGSGIQDKVVPRLLLVVVVLKRDVASPLRGQGLGGVLGLALPVGARSHAEVEGDHD